MAKGVKFRRVQKLFSNHDIINGFLNTVKYTVVGTAINVVLTIMAAYPLSRADFVGRNVIMGIFVFTMFLVAV